MGISADKLAIATLYLNSNINPNIFPTEELKKLHLKLEAFGRPYLDHDSFADCSKVYEKDFEEILKILENDTSCLLGQVNDNDLRSVKQLIKVARTISLRVKKKYGLHV